VSENVVRLADYERKSRDCDAISPRDPADSALIIILPVIRSLNAPGPGSGEFVTLLGTRP
jgi:hypothetical protein